MPNPSASPIATHVNETAHTAVIYAAPSCAPIRPMPVNAGSNPFIIELPTSPPASTAATTLSSAPARVKNPAMVVFLFSIFRSSRVELDVQMQVALRAMNAHVVVGAKQASDLLCPLPRNSFAFRLGASDVTTRNVERA